MDADLKNGTGGRQEWLTVPVVVMVLANLAPVYGVLYFGWTVFPVILFFWFENVIIGVFNVLKFLAAEPGSILKWLGKLFLIPFFCFHYGMFTFVHGIFVFGMFGGGFSKGGSLEFLQVWNVFREQNLFGPVIALVISHGVSFFWNYIGKGEYKTASLDMLMAGPYARVVVLHLTILFGGLLAKVLGAPVYALLLLVLLKIVVDIKAHIRERRKFGLKEAAEMVMDN